MTAPSSDQWGWEAPVSRAEDQGQGGGKGVCDLVKRCWPRYTGSSFSSGISFFSFFGELAILPSPCLGGWEGTKDILSSTNLALPWATSSSYFFPPKANPQPTTGPNFPDHFPEEFNMPTARAITLTTMILPTASSGFCSVYPALALLAWSVLPTPLPSASS